MGASTCLRSVVVTSRAAHLPARIGAARAAATATAAGADATASGTAVGIPRGARVALLGVAGRTGRDPAVVAVLARS